MLVPVFQFNDSGRVVWLFFRAFESSGLKDFWYQIQENYIVTDEVLAPKVFTLWQQRLLYDRKIYELDWTKSHIGLRLKGTIEWWWNCQASYRRSGGCRTGTNHFLSQRLYFQAMWLFIVWTRRGWASPQKEPQFSKCYLWPWKKS